jgi:hypothetical protein
MIMEEMNMGMGHVSYVPQTKQKYNSKKEL